MAINDIFRATATWVGPQGQAIQWVWHYRQSSGTTTSPGLLAAGIKAQLQLAFDEIKVNVDANYTGDNLTLALRDAGTGDFNTIVISSLAGMNGTSTGEGVAPNSSPYVTFPTAVGKSIGKKFLFGVIEGAMDNGQIGVAFLAAMVLFALDFQDPVSDGTNSYLPGNWNEATTSFRQWINGTVGAGLFSGSQYRRLAGRGA